MQTYQDLLAIGEQEDVRMDFVKKTIAAHKATELYRVAAIADDYDRHRNRTIMNFQKLLYTVSGEAVPDNYSANYKIPSRFFNRFTTQQNQYLLGNGVTWEDDATIEKLGEDFDYQLQKAGKLALVGGVSFGFFNLDHIDVFSVLEFAPLYDEENGALAAGIRFWQVDEKKPLRATLYEMDGYTDYIWKNGKGEVKDPKRAYTQVVEHSEADGDRIYDGENYEAFPIVPLWGNPARQSELIGIREQIDAYDLIKSGFCNTIDEASFIYWAIENAGGMDDIDLASFVERMKTLHAATVNANGATASAHSIEAPHEGREALLDRLRRDLYEDYMALDVREIAGGAQNQAQIQAIYEPINSKADDYEYCVLEFLKGIMAVAGIEDNPTFTRSAIQNRKEQLDSVLAAAAVLDEEYVTRKVLTLLGDGDQADEVLERMKLENMERFGEGDGAPGDGGNNETDEKGGNE